MAELITYSRENIFDNLSARLNISNNNRDSFTRIISEVIGSELEAVEKEAVRSFRNEQIENLSGEELESYVFNNYGLNRFPARKAYSNQIQISTNSEFNFGDLNDGANIRIPKGTELGIDFNFESIVFVTKEDYILESDSSSMIISIEALEPGSNYNIASESLNYLNFQDYSKSDNQELTIYQLHDISNGSDEESDESLRLRGIRFLERRTNLNKNALFASLLNEPSIFDFEIIESYYGIGSVGIAIKGYGYGRVSNDEIQKVNEIISEFRFLGQRIEVVLPIEVRLDLKMNVRSSQLLENQDKESLKNEIKKFLLDEIKMMEFQKRFLLKELSDRVLSRFPIENVHSENVFTEAFISKMERFSSEVNPISLDVNSTESIALGMDETFVNASLVVEIGDPSL
jgi:hypothetical protein